MDWQHDGVKIVPAGDLFVEYESRRID